MLSASSCSAAGARLHLTAQACGLCSEKLWRRYVEDIVMEREDPAALARRARMGGRTVARPMTRDVSAVTDKAYEREYLEPDRKRVRRD